VAVTVAVVVAIVITAVVTPLVARLAWRLDVVDRPGPLKVQSRPVPYLGGIAVFAGVALPTLWTRPAILIPLVLAMALGLADDVGDLHSGFRFASELVIGVVVSIVAGLAAPLIVIGALVTVLLINAVNLLDGLDGLASGTAIASGAGFAFVLGGDYRVVASALAAALCGFLLWNRPPASIYLGDAGSYLIGAALAVLATSTIGSSGSASTAAAAALLVGVPVADTSIAVIRRWRAKRPLFKGDRGHVYDQLVDRKWSPERATVACITAQALLAFVAVGVAHLPSGTAVAVSLATIVVVAVWAIPTFTSPSRTVP
jgi:UDP-GlcNAc:undecaprenyl-phosphate GlcNAc-1-phosphate transferase